MNEWTLHHAARDGSIERTLALISSGVDVDEATPTGLTPLQVAASHGQVGVARVLLKKGDDVSAAGIHHGISALHASAQRGHVAVTRLLVKAGADLEAKNFAAATPLFLVVAMGNVEMLGELIGARANVNSRADRGETPLFWAAQKGRVDAVKVFLRAGANPQLAIPSGDRHVPIDVAAEYGHWKVVHELIQDRGIEGCGGESGGVSALCAAAREQHLKVMEMLTRGGVVDTGAALYVAATYGRDSSVKFLLLQWKRRGNREGAAYLGICHPSDGTALVRSIQACSHRITRLLVDAGADTATPVRRKNEAGVVVFDDTPLAYTNSTTRDKKIEGEEATEIQRHSVEATRRLLMSAEAVHAVSWLFSANANSAIHSAAEAPSRPGMTPTLLTLTLPTLRQRAERSRVLLAALFRNSVKP